MTTDVIPLGTASAIPTRERHLSALAVERKGRVFLFDCGEGAQYRLLHADLGRARVDAIFVTHLHGDHCYGLPGLLSTLGVQQRTAPVTLAGPPGLRSMLDALPGDAPDALPYPLRVVKIEGGREEERVYETDEIAITARPLDHRGPTVGFRLEEKVRPGRFDPERARALGVPEGPAFGRLQSGAPVTTEDGMTVRPEQVLGPPRPGIAFAYVTDTRPCDGGRSLAENSDLLYHEATFSEDLRERAVETGHSTAHEAATVARDAGAERLLLGHLSARYDDPSPLVREAREVFPETDMADELRRYTLDPREKEPGRASAADES